MSFFLEFMLASFSMTAMRSAWASDVRMRFTSVVLPLPRNPVRMVTGVLTLLLRASVVVLSPMRLCEERERHGCRKVVQQEASRRRTSSMWE